MKNLAFPLNFTFKITTLANDFTAVDANGNTIAYVREKILKLKDDVDIYSDESKSEKLYNIKANQWIDWSASYKMTDANGGSLGRIGRKGWRSVWKATYEIFDANDNMEFTVREENAWVKVGDAFLSEIPFLGLISGYVFNPGYIVSKNDGTIVARIKKQPSFWGRRFLVTRLASLDPYQEERIVLGLMMTILQERRRG